MAFEELKENAEHIQEEVKSYFENSLAYYKLKIFKLIMKSSVTILKIMLIVVSFILVLLFGSFALAFALSNYFESYALGFLAVMVLYVFITVFLFLFRRKLIEGPILKKFSFLFFNN
ncbi:competence protein [Flavobacterium faecale]|uniref:competence protein n=1 Tax=Flavobacterium faecale TaxID=1355330 RepID=UPI003AABC04D